MAPHDRGELVAERTRVELRAVAGDHAGALEALDALGGRGRREVDAPAELGERDPAVRDELGDDLAVGGVELSVLHEVSRA